MLLIIRVLVLIPNSLFLFLFLFPRRGDAALMFLFLFSYFTGVPADVITRAAAASNPNPDLLAPQRCRIAAHRVDQMPARRRYITRAAAASNPSPLSRSMTPNHISMAFENTHPHEA